MCAKQYLRQAFRLNELIQSNEKELEELKELSTSLSGTDYSKDKVQSSSSNDANYVRIIEKILDLEKVIERDIEGLLSLRLEIRNTISQVKDNEERLLLQYRYLNFLTWDEICDEMHVSSRTVHRIHASALKNVKIGTL